MKIISLLYTQYQETKEEIIFLFLNLTNIFINQVFIEWKVNFKKYN